jgi:ribose 5-phosphate isomerase B
MKIYIGSDHAGFQLKEKLKSYLAELEYVVHDKGAFSLNEGDDYPDFIAPTAQSVASDPESFGIVIGGSGQGEAISANRIKGARACVYYGNRLEIIEVARQHNNANILSLGARFMTDEEAEKAVHLFLNTKFSEDDRHVRRINKLESK